MVPLIICLSILAFIIIFTFVFSFVAYRLTFYNGKRLEEDLTPLKGDQYNRYNTTELINKAKEIPYEKIYITSFDNLRLFARYYQVDDKSPLFIMFNGYKGNGLRDFAGGLQLNLELGYNLIVVDQRSHGRSEGNSITFGVKERKDVLSWIEYAINRFGKDRKIVIQGISMGAATILMSSNLINYDNVIALLADCPYSSPKEIIKLVIKRDMKLMPSLVYPFIYLGGLLFARFKLNSSSAIESIKECKLPVLIIHGTGDDFVPVTMSEKIKENNPDIVQLVEVDGAPHGLSFMQDYDLYKETVINFYKKIGIR